MFGHSHRYSWKERGGRWWLNPGSAGPARFSLPRSMAILRLPQKGSGQAPQVEQLVLAPKAPPRLKSSSDSKQREERSCASGKQTETERGSGKSR